VDDSHPGFVLRQLSGTIRRTVRRIIVDYDDLPPFSSQKLLQPVDQLFDIAKLIEGRDDYRDFAWRNG
jgi:hypothetical protein